MTGQARGGQRPAPSRSLGRRRRTAAWRGPRRDRRVAASTQVAGQAAVNGGLARASLRPYQRLAARAADGGRRWTVDRRRSSRDQTAARAARAVRLVTPRLVFVSKPSKAWESSFPWRCTMVFASEPGADPQIQRIRIYFERLVNWVSHLERRTYGGSNIEISKSRE